MPSPSDATGPAPGGLPSHAALLALLRARRSVRRFLPDPVSAAEEAALVEAAALAPSAGGRQSWRLLLVRSPERIARMAEAVREAVARIRGELRPEARAEAGAYLDDFLHFAGAPLVVAAIHRGGLDLLAAAGAQGPALRRAEADSLASLAAALENLLLCATALGLGACWMTGPLVAAPALGPILEVPAGWTLGALVPVGRPAEAPAPPPRRALAALARSL
jgi:nitroreductase